MNDKQTVLISGCSSGIGRSLAIEFADKGFQVIATARKPEIIQYLEGDNISVFQLDVTDLKSINRCVNAVLKKYEKIDILVNNAGYGQMGPLSDVPIDRIRQQYETNVIGSISLIQKVIPSMIKAEKGMIINISSVSGTFTTPFAGVYCSSKAALNSISDALRIELAPFGIKVVTVRPGGIKTKFGDTAFSGLEFLDRKKSVYAGIADFVEKRAISSQDNPMSVEKFAGILVQKISGGDPEPVICLGEGARKLPMLKFLLPVKVLDRIQSRVFGLNRL
jgi:short-subunit dehydrogenase